MLRTGSVVLTLVCSSLAALPLRAEIVPKSAEEMREMATHVVLGKVKGVYTSTARRGDYQQTHYLAELAIEKIEKGEGLKEKQLIYVRYWTQRWVGTGKQPPGTNGHRGLPAVGQAYRVYLVNKGYDGGGEVSDGGYNVVFADGFEGLKPEKK
jgi:hypothetical protein